MFHKKSICITSDYVAMYCCAQFGMFYKCGIMKKKKSSEKVDSLFASFIIFFWLVWGVAYLINIISFSSCHLHLCIWGNSLYYCPCWPSSSPSPSTFCPSPPHSSSSFLSLLFPLLPPPPASSIKWEPANKKQPSRSYQSRFSSILHSLFRPWYLVDMFN